MSSVFLGHPVKWQQLVQKFTPLSIQYPFYTHLQFSQAGTNYHLKGRVKE